MTVPEDLVQYRVPGRPQPTFQLIGLTGVKENAKGTLKRRWSARRGLHDAGGQLGADQNGASSTRARAGEPSAVPASSSRSPNKEEKPALSQAHQSAKIKASATQVAMIQSEVIQAACRIPGCTLREPHSPTREARKLSASLSRRRPQRHDCRRSRCFPQNRLRRAAKGLGR